MTNKQPKYDESFKKNIVALHQNGKTQTELSKEYGISTSAISHWIRLYSEVKVRRWYNHDSKADKGTAKKKCSAWGGKHNIKKSACHNDSTLRERMRAVHLLRHEHAIITLCRVLNVNRSSYYKHFNSKESKRAIENRKIKNCILQIYSEAIIDLFSRRVIVYKLGKNIDTKLVLDTFESALKNRDYPKMWFFTLTEVRSIPAMNSEKGWTELPLFSRFLKKDILMTTLWLKPFSSSWNLKKLTAVLIALLTNWNCLFLNTSIFTISIALILLITFCLLHYSKFLFSISNNLSSFLTMVHC